MHSKSYSETFESGNKIVFNAYILFDSKSCVVEKDIHGKL